MLIIFYGLLILLAIMMILATIVGIGIKPHVNWFAGLLWYVLSFLGSMSIGLYLLVFPFVLWTLALAHTFGLTKNRENKGVFIAIGILLWIVCITTIDDVYLFYPFKWLLNF